MPAGSPQGRFFLRGSALLILMLVIWWFALLQPLLFLLRVSAETCGSVAFGVSHDLVTVTASGNWTFRVPLELIMANSNGQPGAVRIHSIDFDLSRSDAIAFTFGLPVFWAIMLAASGIRRSLPALLSGTILLAILEIILLLVFVEVSARKVALQMAESGDGAAKWFLHFAEYLLVSVIPYVAPFLIALFVNRELSSQIFGWAEASALPAEKSSRLRGGGRPGAKRRRATLKT